MVKNVCSQSFKYSVLFNTEQATIIDFYINFIFLIFASKSNPFLLVSNPYKINQFILDINEEMKSSKMCPSYRSKNYFVLSSSMDKTVRLWHISRRECLCCFQHIEFVTAIAFHPRDDRYFLSGSLDGKLRLWNIPDKKVAVWNEVEGQSKLITAANFCQVQSLITLSVSLL